MFAFTVRQAPIAFVLAAMTAGCAASGASPSAEPVWPGTSTRFYPGIYARAGGPNMDAGKIEAALNEWWGTVDRDRYREVRDGHRLTHVGIKCAFGAKAIFGPYWYSHAHGPYDYRSKCTNSHLMQDPDAEVDGHKVYDWTWFDSILALPLVEGGECKVMFKYDDQDIRGNHCAWWRTQGMMMASGQHPRKYDWVYARCKMDFLKAFATRYAGNPKIAGFEIEEYAGVRDEGPTCGYVVPGQSWQVSAENGSSFYPAKAMLEADPGLMILFVGPAAFVSDYFEGRGGGLGLDALPGVQGVAVQDLRFFVNTCGTGAPGTVDAKKGDWGMYWLAQQAMLRDDLAVMVHAERNGWRARATDRRTGELNPWNVSAWPKTDRPWDGEKPGGVGSHMFPDPAFWVWYCSGPPRADGTAADSGLGQPGPDPAGVISAHFYDPSLPWTKKIGGASANGKFPDGWNATNLSRDRFRRAFEIFGPSGTKAMFRFPKGYVEAVLRSGKRHFR